jgi:hypothetical protein
MQRVLLGASLAVAFVGCTQTHTPLTASSGTTGGASTSASTTTTSAGTGTSTGSSSSGTSSGSTTSGTSTTTSSGTTGGMPCLTAANCAGLSPVGQVCLDGGYCGEPPPPSSVCTAVGQACGPGLPGCCAGPCLDFDADLDLDGGGQCTPWSPCGDLGATCLATSDCCSYEACDAGRCVSSCIAVGGACQQDSECCLQEGLYCLPESDGGPRHCDRPFAASCQPASAPQCNLGTLCTVDASGSDPCAPAGYICDPFFRACRSPYPYETCLPGGPACQPATYSTASVVCASFFQGSQEINLCLQPCTATSDCVDVVTSCQNVLGGKACLTNFGCIDYFQSCSSAGSGDGTCYPFTNAGQTSGYCVQASADAGPGCAFAANRQNGGLCPVGEYCLGALCQPMCNAGTAGGLACDGGTYCQFLFQMGDPTDLGVCAQQCDITDLDGGGCMASALPEKCLPSFFYGLPDNGAGICVQEASNAPAIGQPCDFNHDVFADTCGQAALCGFLNSTISCLQICDGIGHQDSCPAGLSCQRGYSNGQPSTITGVCGP